MSWEEKPAVICGQTLEKVDLSNRESGGKYLGPEKGGGCLSGF